MAGVSCEITDSCLAMIVTGENDQEREQLNPSGSGEVSLSGPFWTKLRFSACQIRVWAGFKDRRPIGTAQPPASRAQIGNRHRLDVLLACSGIEAKSSSLPWAGISNVRRKYLPSPFRWRACLHLDLQQRRQLAGRRSQSGLVRSLSDREGRTGHRGPGPESLNPMAVMVRIGEISGMAEEVRNLVVERQESLRLAC